jgi:predicted Zn-dependent protease
MVFRKLVSALLAAVLVVSCSSNPATGGKNVVLGTTQGEKEQSRRYYDQIIAAYGLYEDQAVQDYVNAVGQRVARNSHLADWDFKFTVLDDESVNAFTTGGGYVYVHRGLLYYLNTEAELAAVLGHEIAHVTARHPARRQTRGVLASVLATAAAIGTGSSAVAQLANIGATAWLQGYGRENEMEADRLGLEYSLKTGYRPEAMQEVFKVFKAQETFEINRAKAEGREPRVYHGIFSSHPAPDDRQIQAAKGAANVTTEPPDGWIDNRDPYLKILDGMPYGSSRAQGIVRDNRFYHAGLGLTMAFPKSWTIENQRDRILAYTRSKDAIMQITSLKRDPKQSPREFLIKSLRGASIAKGEELEVNGMQGYALITRHGSPLDGGEGPVRWAVLYRGDDAYLFGGASRSGTAGLPADDGLFMSSIQTLRALKTSEYPLAEPYRIKVVQGTDDKKKLEEYAKAMPVDRYKKEELQLLNGVYPSGKFDTNGKMKVVE